MFRLNKQFYRKIGTRMFKNLAMFSKKYDVAVIGGGPGGSFGFITNSVRLCGSDQGWSDGSKNSMHRGDEPTRWNLS